MRYKSRSYFTAWREVFGKDRATGDEVEDDEDTARAAKGKAQKESNTYGLQQAFRSWNTRFDEVIRGYDFIKNEHGPCVYKKISGSSVAYLVLYIDDILLNGNDVKVLGDITGSYFH
ncbi:UNVERIFIED_CONTAM: hypothetical protein Sradi_3868200 [Sesamum radiatum]|uniref:Reverse transcriptase Ty1/copia-type domain-containing protein n=1 Tax=Sesamum radiatum TaxID=300843 RepID=A0AAW2Q267_SESRA